MIADGKAIAKRLKGEIAAEVRTRRAPPALTTVQVGDNPVSERFLAIKKKFAADIGVPVEDLRFPADTRTAEVVACLIEVAGRSNTGVIVQLPLPPGLAAQEILDAVPPAQDVDVLSEESARRFEEGAFPILPTVVGAFREILREHGIGMQGKRALVVGQGKLVGKPAAMWLARAGALVTVADRATPGLSALAREADIIILGAGVPGLLKPDMVKEGVIILDAGTSEQGGKLAGDADPRCAEKAALFTPTPGGIGPITVAMVFKNLLTLTE